MDETRQHETITAWLLPERDAERKWDELFALPVSESLQQLADEALEDHRAGRTSPL